MAKNEIMATTDTKVNEYVGGDKKTFLEMIQSSIGISDLAVGKKFDTDDLVKADMVRLLDYDIVSYLENEGAQNEREVNFAVWSVEVSNEDGTGVMTTETGYYQGGTVMTKIAKAIARHGAYEDLRKFGIAVKCRWSKTSGKNDILLVDIIG